MELICFQTLDPDTALGEWSSVAISSNIYKVSQGEITLALNLTAGVCLIYKLGPLKKFLLFFIWCVICFVFRTPFKSIMNLCVIFSGEY